MDELQELYEATEPETGTAAGADAAAGIDARLRAVDVRSADVFAKCYAFKQSAEVKAAGLYPYFRALDANEGPECVVDGRRLVMLGSNNYLGLTTHPRVREAATDAVRRFGTSMTGSRFLNGTLRQHEELEAALAAFVGKAAALVFATGFQANLAAISALVRRGDYAVLDRYVHASIVDGAKLSDGKVVTFKHNSPGSLRRALERAGAGSGKLLIVDGVYSMEGDVVDLPALLPVAKQAGARLLCDDAHALGVLGRGGRGTADHFGLTAEVDLIMGTFSKTFASVGGFVAGDADVIEYVKHYGRSMIFSASLPPPNVATGHAALDVIHSEPEIVDRLWRNQRRMLDGIRGMGFDTGPCASPVIPVPIGDEVLALQIWRELFDGGSYTNCILYPAVPKGRAMLRTSVMATHEDRHLDRALETIREVARRRGLIPG